MTRTITTIIQLLLVAGTIWLFVPIVKDIRRNGLFREKVICRRCATPVVFDEVSRGYYAVCPECYEDLYEIETEVI